MDFSKLEVGRVYPITDAHAFISLKTPDKNKILYCLIEYPKSDYLEEGQYNCVINAYSLEEFFGRILKLLSKTLQRYHFIYEGIAALGIENWSSIEDAQIREVIERSFVKEVFKPSDDIDFGHTWSGVVKDENGEYSLGMW